MQNNSVIDSKIFVVW